MNYLSFYLNKRLSLIQSLSYFYCKVFLNNDSFLEVLEGNKASHSLKGGTDLLGDVSKTALQKLDEKL